MISSPSKDPGPQTDRSDFLSSLSATDELMKSPLLSGDRREVRANGHSSWPYISPSSSSSALIVDVWGRVQIYHSTSVRRPFSTRWLWDKFWYENKDHNQFFVVVNNNPPPKSPQFWISDRDMKEKPLRLGSAMGRLSEWKSWDRLSVIDEVLMTGNDLKVSVGRVHSRSRGPGAVIL